MGVEPETRAFFILIANSMALVLLWMVMNVLFGIYLEFAFFKNTPGIKNPTYWDIQHRLPSETKSYVMNFITLNVIFKNYEKFISNSLRFKDQQPSGDLQKAEKQTEVAVL